MSNMTPLDHIMLDEVNQCQEHGLSVWLETVNDAAAELAALRATVAQQAARIAELEQAVSEARQQLRSTQENWREDCLYKANDILSAVLPAPEVTP